MFTRFTLLIISFVFVSSSVPAEVPHGPSMFEDDFSEGTGKWIDSDKGQVRDGWYHLRGDYGKVHRVTIKDSEKWSDYIVEFDVKVMDTIASWMVRCDLGQGGGYYLFCFNGRELERNIRTGNNSPAGSTKLKDPVRLGEPHHMTIVVKGSVIRHYLDGKLIDTLTDDSIAHGGFGFREMNSEAGAFANIKVFALPPANDPVAPGRRQNRASIPFTSRPPKLDGRIDDAVWNGAARLTGFSDLGGKLAHQQTAVWAMWDEANLYLAFESKKRFENRRAKKPRDGGRLFDYDAIEINLQPTPDTWYKLAFDHVGSKWDSAYQGLTMNYGQWDPEWKVANHIINDAYNVIDTWQAEVAIPFASIGVEAPAEGDLWPAQICRDFDDRNNLGYPAPERWTSWTQAVEGGFNAPSTFGEFRFVRNAPVFRLQAYADIGNGRGGLRGSVVGGEAGNSKLFLRAWRNTEPGKPLMERTIAAAGSLDIRGALDVPEVCDVTMSWDLRGLTGQSIARGQIVAESIPSFALTYAPLFTRNELAVEGDLSRMQDLPANADIVIQLEDGAGTVLAKAVHRVATADGRFLFRLSIAGVPAGKYTAAVTMLDGDKTVASSRRNLEVPPAPDWQGKGVGILTDVPAPWTPVEVEQTDSVKVKTWSKTYHFTGLLPSRIDILGEPRLSAPAKLVIITDGGRQELSYGAPVVSDQSALGVTMAWAGRTKDIEVRGRTRVEFDGLIWVDMTLAPRRDGVTVQQAYIEIPMRRRGLRYMRGENSMDFLKSDTYIAMIAEGKLDRAYPQPGEKGEFSTTGWAWPDRFINFYWLGGVDYGLFVILPSHRNLHIQKRYNELIETDDEARFRLYLIDKPVTLTEATAYQFGLIGTPTRPMRDRNEINRTGFIVISDTDWSYFENEIAKDWDGALKDKYFMGPKKTIGKDDLYARYFHAGDLSYLGNPYPDEAQNKSIRDSVSKSRELDMRPMMWMDLTYTPITLPHEIAYAYEWEQFPRKRNIYGGEGCTLVCPKEGSWADFYLYGMDRLMKDEGVKGVFLDMTGPGACSNQFHGCGYEVDGERKGEIPFLELRGLFLRLYNVVHSNDPDGIVFYHSNSWNPTVLYVDLDTKGEGWGPVDDYRTFSLPYYQAGYMFQHQYNVQHNFYAMHLYPSSRGKPERVSTLAECIGMTLLHDTLPCAQTSLEVTGLLTVWNGLNDFGAYDKATEWVPYWESGIGDWHKGPAVSYYRRNGQYFMVIFNHDFDNDRSLRLDLKARNVSEAYDVVTGKARKAEVIELNLSPRELALLWLR